jgi:hypothetical protein
MSAVSWLKEKVKETYDKEGKLPLGYILNLISQAKAIEAGQKAKAAIPVEANNKITAIEWLLHEKNSINTKEYLSKKEHFRRHIVAEREAIEMFKEQINQAYMTGLIDAKNKKPKNYYKDTYESDSEI